MRKLPLPQGFTLIELLIVITIIGILAVSLLPTVVGAPGRARDAARKATINNIVAALESYNTDHQEYPEGSLCLGDFSGTDGADDLNQYFPNNVVPADPQQSGAATGIGGCSNGQFLYCRLDGNPGNYYLASYIETNPISGGGCTPSTLLPNNGSSNDVATPDCFSSGSGGDEPPVMTADGPYAIYYVVH